MGEPKQREIVLTPEAQTFLSSLPPKRAARMWNAIGQLEQGGPNLGAPTVKLIKGSDEHNMKELRAAGSLRLLFKFDRHQRAVMLVGGDKRGQWNKWYPKAIKAAQEALGRHERNTGEVTTWRGTGRVRGDPSATRSR
jgi:hypothetical protein